MNPLCCIAPVSLERGDRGSAPVVPLKANAKPTAGSDNPARNSSSKQLAPAQVSVAAGNPELGPSCEGEDGASRAAEGKDVKSGGGVNGKVAGILYKWVNYGKGWRSRWFVLQDGVLSYYKLHGPDKISVGSACEANDARVIGEDSLRRARREQRAGEMPGNGEMKQWKPFGEIHLKVSSIRSSKSDDKRLSIFTGTKTLHLRCESRDDRSSWIEALHLAKDMLPRFATSNDLSTAADIAISTEKLRTRLLEEGLDETVIKECESIVLCETSELLNQLRCLQQKHVVLLDALRQLETEKLELETTVVDETKEREANLGQGNGRFSEMYLLKLNSGKFAMKKIKGALFDA